MLTCVEYLETSMPLAVARQFVEEFITDSKKVKIQSLDISKKCVYKVLYLHFTGWWNSWTNQNCIQTKNCRKAMAGWDHKETK